MYISSNNLPPSNLKMRVHLFLSRVYPSDCLLAKFLQWTKETDISHLNSLSSIPPKAFIVPRYIDPERSKTAMVDLVMSPCLNTR